MTTSWEAVISAVINSTPARGAADRDAMASYTVARRSAAW